MLQSTVSSSLGLIGQIEPWMVSWLTPLWYLAVGIGMGLIVLGLWVAVFRLLSFVPGWNRIGESQSNPLVGHGLAAVLTAVLSFFVLTYAPREAMGNSALQEPLLLGIATVLLCAIIGWAIVFCSTQKAAAKAWMTLREGVAGYLGITALVIVVIGGTIWGFGALLNSPIVPEPDKALASIGELFLTGNQEFSVTVPGVKPGESADFVEFDIPVRFDLIRGFNISTDRSIVLADSGDITKVRVPPVRMGAGESFDWSSIQSRQEMPIPYYPNGKLYVQNKEIDQARVVFKVETSPPVPEAASFIITAIAVVLIGLALLLQDAVAPRSSAIALATIKNELAQPLFAVLMILGVIAILIYEYLSFNTFGEDIKLLKDCGITTIMLLAAFQGIWSASSSISEEIEGRTALTVLSKPIQRRSFVFGKFLGIFWVLFLMFVILGTIELGAVAYKPIYDAREISQEMPTWQICHSEMVRTVPGLAMAFMQAIVLTSISVALATRLPQLANLAICFSIYVLGNLTTSLVSSTQDSFPIVEFIAQLVATIIPILEHFQLQAAIDSGNPITMSLLAGSLVYCLLYVLLSMFLALLLFEDRDLA